MKPYLAGTLMVLLSCVGHPSLVQSQTVETVGCAGQSSCPGIVNQCYVLTNGPGQSGMARYKEKWDFNGGLAAPLRVHLGDDSEKTKMVFLIANDYIVWNCSTSAGALDTYLSGAQEYVAVSLETHLDGVPGQVDNLSLTIVQGGAPVYFSGEIPALASGTNIEDGAFHDFTIIWNATNKEFVLIFDNSVRYRYCPQIPIFQNNPLVYFGMAAATDAVADTQIVGLQNTDFALTCCPASPGCISDASFFQGWYAVGIPEKAIWEIDPLTLSTVTQRLNDGPAIFALPLDLLNVEIKFKMSVSKNAADRDCIGMVWGMKEPSCGVPYDYDMWMFSWRGETDNTCSSAYLTSSGYTFARVTGLIPPGCGFQESEYYFWGNNSGPQFQVLNKIPAAGWEYDSTYRVTLLYTASKIVVKINDMVVLERKGCFEPGRFGFYAYSQPEVSFSNFSYTHVVDFSTESDTLCEDESVNFRHFNRCGQTLDATSVNSIEWDFGDGTVVKNAYQPSHTYQSAGSYLVTLTVGDNNNCIGKITKTLFVLPAPDKPDFTAIDVSCPGNSDGEITVHFSPADFEYSVDGIDFSPDTVTGSFSSGNYLLYTRDPAGCTRSDSFFISEPPPLYLDFWVRNPLPMGDTAHIKTRPYPDGAPLTYKWERVDSMYSVDSIDCFSCPWPTVRPLENAIYRVTITDTFGCTFSTNIAITVINEDRVYVPNVFLLNAGTENSYVTVYCGPEVYQIRIFEIYSRRGDLVFRNINFPPNSPTDGWTGYIKGKRALPEVYAYRVVYELIDGTVKYKWGTITLLY
ncbi:MAG: PKD domain-containing protein [Saprospiraceae bacterium]|nr:PKD domain-containing protein [Saprospiraceae bacterium]MCB0572956.1 PKD domain-containing protein [Saprospiraceae bacterium]MCB9306036.1 PKD domain-containing protein [Lewinellaceae bacterium]